MQNLTGSEKQIAWANTIREQVASAMRTATEAAEQYLRDQTRMPTANADGIMEIVREYVAGIMANTSAGWWIDNRGLVLGHDAPITSPMAYNMGNHLLTTVFAASERAAHLYRRANW